MSDRNGTHRRSRARAAVARWILGLGMSVAARVAERRLHRALGSRAAARAEAGSAG